MGKISAIKNSEDLCWNCLKKKENIQIIKIDDLGYGSYFDGSPTEIHLCQDCYEKSKGVWKLEVVKDSMGFYSYSNEDEMFDFIKQMPIAGRQFVLNEFESGWNSRPMEPQDWIDYQLDLLPYEKCKEYGLYAPEEIKAYQERFPKCNNPALRIFSDGSGSTWCPFGAIGTKEQGTDLNISEECFRCNHYRERVEPLRVIIETKDDNSEKWCEYKMRCLLGEI